MKFQELKSLLGCLATQIKQEKVENKEYQRAHNGAGCYFGASSWTFRHHHIAYCELRGTPREKIERPADNNKPDEAFIQRIKDSIERPEPVERPVHEAVCAGA